MVWFTRSSCDYGGLGGSFRILRQQLQTALPESSGPLLQEYITPAYWMTDPCHPICHGRRHLTGWW